MATASDARPCAQMHRRGIAGSEAPWRSSERSVRWSSLASRPSMAASISIRSTTCPSGNTPPRARPISGSPTSRRPPFQMRTSALA